MDPDSTDPADPDEETTDEETTDEETTDEETTEGDTTEGDTTDGETARSNRSARRRAGELSGLVLDVLRAAGVALTPAGVQQRLIDLGVGRLVYTTVVTILSRLHEQGLVERYRAGRAFAYLAVADTALAAHRMRRVLDDQPDRRDRDAVLANFVQDLSSDDERQLRALLRALDRGPDSAGDTDPPTSDR